MGDSATVLIKGDNEALKKAIADSKQMLLGFASFFSENVKTKQLTLFDKTQQPVPTGFREMIQGLTGDLSKLDLSFVSLLTKGAGLAIGMFTLTAVFNSLRDSIRSLQQSLTGALEKLGEGEYVTAKLAQGLKNVGYIAQVSMSDIQKVGDEIERTTTFSATQVKEAANAMLRFRNIRGEMFKDTLKALPNFAAMQGTDLATAATMWGRALNDPIRGMRQLRVLGYAMTTQEEERINRLIQSKRVVEAQAIVMARMNELSKNQAAILKESTAGKESELAQSWSNFFKILVGGEVEDAWKQLIDTTKEFVDMLKALAENPVFIMIRDSVGSIAQGLLLLARTVLAVFSTVFDAITIGFEGIYLAYLEAYNKMRELTPFGRSAEVDKDIEETTDKIKAKAAIIVDRWKAIGKDVAGLFGFGGEEEKAKEGVPPEMDVKAGGASQVGTFEALEDLYKRISSAAGGMSAADRAAEAGEEVASNTSTMASELAMVNANLSTLISISPAPGALANA